MILEFLSSLEKRDEFTMKIQGDFLLEFLVDMIFAILFFQPINNQLLK